MDEQVNEQQRNDDEMHRREITLEDGRYMIFYTFGDEEQPPDTDEQNEHREDV